MFNNNIISMRSKQINREYEAQVSVITRARSTRSATGINIDKGSKKGMESIAHANSEHAQNGKHLSIGWENMMNEDNSIISTKKIQKVKEQKLLSSDDRLKVNSYKKRVKNFHKLTASSWNNLELNKTPRQLKISSKLSGGNKVNLYATELSNNPVVSILKPRECFTNSQSSSARLSSTKKYSVNSAKELTVPRALTLEANCHSELREGNTRLNSNNTLSKLNVSDTVAASGYDLLNSNAATHCRKTRSKNISLAAVKYNSGKFTKSVKMVLSSPKSIFRNSRSVNLTPITHNNFRCNDNKNVPQSNGRNAKLINNYNTSVGRDINIGRANNIDMVDTFQGNACTVKESIVLVQKLCNIVTIARPPQSLSSSTVRIRVNDRFAKYNINVSRKTFDSVFGHLPNEGIRYCKKTESCIEIGPNVNSQPDSMENLCYVLGNITEPLPEPVMSSTPKDQEGLNVTVNKRQTRKMLRVWDTTLELSTSNTFLNQCQDHGSVKTDKVQREVKRQNETYELIAPKTPNLRKKLEDKRSDGGKKGVKKNVKVRLTNPPTDANYKLLCHAQYSEENQLKSLTNVEKRTLNSPASVRRTKPNSVSSQGELTPRSKIYHSTKSCAKVNIAATSQSVTHARKSDPKYFSSTKKVPNFAVIHRNMFAKSESILDAKKRLRDRHTALTMTKGNNLMKIKPNSGDKKQPSSESNIDSYNRFGLKTRKRDATDCILRKNGIHVIRSKERSRAILKGVRTNRRFELQMKSRNLDL